MSFKCLSLVPQMVCYYPLSVWAASDRLNSEVGRINYWFNLLPQSYFLVRNQLHVNMFHFHNNLVQTSKDSRSAVVP